jgi:hypothetical protein
MSSLRPGLRLWLAASFIIVFMVLAYRGVRNMRADPHAPLRDSIAVLRVAADSCRVGVDSGVAALRGFNDTLTAMRTRVRGLEALDERGVPIDSYPVYMDAFEGYNRAAGEWAAREDSVRAQDGRCRDVARTHNVLADSMSRIIRALQRRR